MCFSIMNHDCFRSKLAFVVPFNLTTDTSLKTTWRAPAACEQMLKITLSNRYQFKQMQYCNSKTRGKPSNQQ